MKLLVVTPEYLPTSGGGIVTFYRHLLPALVELGVEVTVVVGSAVHQPGGDARSGGLRVVGLTPARFEHRLREFAHLEGAPLLARHLAAAWALWDEARALGSFNRVEAVDWGLGFVPWVLRPETPVLVRGHGSLGQIALHEGTPLSMHDALTLALERLVLCRASAVASYSHANVQDWERLLPTAQPCYVAPALPVASIAATSLAPWLLVLARVQEWKGPWTLGDAMTRDAALPNVRWVGRDVPGRVSASTLGELRARQGEVWTHRIEHHATVPAAVAQDWIGEARAVVVPSRWDVFNFAGAEAMAAGAVVCASTGAGMSELVENGVNGFVAPAGDPAALADRLRQIAALSAEQRAEIGQAARVTIRTRLDPAQVARENRALLESLDPPKAEADPLDRLLTPGGEPGRPYAYLSQYPVRALLSHVAERVKQRWLS